MFSSFSPFSTIKFGFGRSSSSPSIPLPPVPTHDPEHNPSKRSRRLKHLLKLNHVNHAILFNHRKFHNHTPHLLGSAYILGATPDHLNAVYESEAASGLVPWEDSPGEIARYDWRDFLGQREYERAFVDFFEDQMVLRGYDWKAVVGEFVLENGKKGEGPLISNLITAGLGHPLIHLGYAYELNSREVAMEALGLVATNYNAWHKYLDDPGCSKQGPNAEGQMSDPLEILDRVNADKRLDGLFSEPGGSNLDEVFTQHESILLEHWNAWEISDPKKQFEQSQRAAVAILISAAHASSSPPPQQQHEQQQPSTTQPSSFPSPPKHKYDFFLLHLLTTTHALRILLPHLPIQHHIPLLRQWFLLALALYIAQLRPRINIQHHILDYDTQGRGWEWVIEQQALKGEHALDAHYVKGIRAMKVAAETWGDGGNGSPGDEDGDGEGKDFYRRAAVRFAAEFNGWGGFSAAEEAEEEMREKEQKRKVSQQGGGG